MASKQPGLRAAAAAFREGAGVLRGPMRCLRILCLDCVWLVIECGRSCPCLERRSKMTLQLWAYASGTAHETASCTSKGGGGISCTIVHQACAVRRAGAVPPMRVRIQLCSHYGWRPRATVCDQFRSRWPPRRALRGVSKLVGKRRKKHL